MEGEGNESPSSYIHVHLPSMLTFWGGKGGFRATHFWIFLLYMLCILLRILLTNCLISARVFFLFIY